MAKDFIVISKRKVRHLLELYTLQGRTQEEAAEIALKGQNTGGLSYAVIGRRVLHYLGLNMNYRRDYYNEGLTSEVIGRILSNRTLAFPLMLPINENLPPALNFDQELEEILHGTGKHYKLIGCVQNIVALAGLAYITYIFMSPQLYNNRYDSMGMVVLFALPICFFCGIPLILKGEGKQFSLGATIEMIVIVVLMMVLLLVAQY